MSSSNFAEALHNDGELFYTSVGYSMYPLVSPHQDILHIVRTEDYQIGDVLLFRNSNNQYVLHRLIKRNKKGLRFAGDHNRFRDPYVNEEAVLGKLMDITKGDKRKIVLDEEKKSRRFFYVHCFHLKAVLWFLGDLLHLRKIK